jgi:F0F1-type ATP synthase membrane subunit b/b'
MEETRRDALERRARIVADTRSEVERTISDATHRIHMQALATRERLDRDTDAIATTIVERVLGRNAS